jgi:HJR/Mrr/RecB family endonuclease
VGLLGRFTRVRPHDWLLNLFEVEPPPEEVRQYLIGLPTPSAAAISKWNLLIEELAHERQSLDSLDWRSFELLIAELLERFDWQVQPMGGSQDGGVDLIAVKSTAPDFECEMLVQCKKYAPHRKVEVSIVRELWAVRWKRASHQAMLATTSTFTRGAQKQAEEWKLQLRDHDRIIQWCRSAVGIYVPDTP